MNGEVMPARAVHQAPLRTRMAQGVGLVTILTAINLVVMGRDIDAPAWMLILMIVGVAICGAVGGATYYATDSMRARGGWRSTFANVASLLAYALLAFGMMSLALYFG